MNYTGVLVIILAAIMLAACGSTGKVEEPLPVMANGGMVANGGAGETGKIDDLPAPTSEVQDPQPQVPIIAPRIKQAQIVGILRELRANGCIIKGLHDVNHIHYAELKITCGDVAKPLASQ